MARTSRAMTVKELRVSAKGRWYELFGAAAEAGAFQAGDTKPQPFDLRHRFEQKPLQDRRIVR
jgi:hypothetical protein